MRPGDTDTLYTSAGYGGRTGPGDQLQAFDEHRHVSRHLQTEGREHAVPVAGVERLPDGQRPHRRAVHGRMALVEGTEGHFLYAGELHEQAGLAQKVDQDDEVTHPGLRLGRVRDDPGQREGAGLVPRLDEGQHLLRALVVQANPAHLAGTRCSEARLGSNGGLPEPVEGCRVGPGAALRKVVDFGRHQSCPSSVELEL